MVNLKVLAIIYRFRTRLPIKKEAGGRKRRGLAPGRWALPAELKSFIDQVRDNCRIAAAGQAGGYSLCGMLLRLRQLYKWEQGLPPWQEADPQAILEWIAAVEENWSDIQEIRLKELSFGGRRLDPFAVEELNAALQEENLVYGAGYTHGLAPTCFLGELLESRREGSCLIFILGQELARDLDASLALRQGDLLYLRTEPLAFYLWDNLADPAKQGNLFLKIALAAYGLELPHLLQRPADHQETLERLLWRQAEALLRHELGEAREPALKRVLPVLVSRFPQSRIERWIRALKDALADVNDWGRVRYLLQERDLAGLALLLAWRPGFYPYLLPELEPAFFDLWRHRDWQLLEQARRQALSRLRQTAAQVEALVPEAPEAIPLELARTLDEQFIKPLGL